jgi:hypothetical protein
MNSVMLTTMADKGVGKNKSKVTLAITPASTYSKMLSFNLKSGLTYKGTLINNTTSNNSSILSNTLITYQKGNTIFIVPFKQKVVIPEVRQGYTGMKLIIHPKL